jgi:hypothetical protein
MAGIFTWWLLEGMHLQNKKKEKTDIKKTIKKMKKRRKIKNKPNSLICQSHIFYISLSNWTPNLILSHLDTLILP